MKSTSPENHLAWKEILQREQKRQDSQFHKRSLSIPPDHIAQVLDSSKRHNSSVEPIPKKPFLEPRRADSSFLLEHDFTVTDNTSQQILNARRKVYLELIRKNWMDQQNFCNRLYQEKTGFLSPKKKREPAYGYANSFNKFSKQYNSSIKNHSKRNFPLKLKNYHYAKQILSPNLIKI